MSHSSLLKDEELQTVGNLSPKIVPSNPPIPDEHNITINKHIKHLSNVSSIPCVFNKTHGIHSVSLWSPIHAEKCETINVPNQTLIGYLFKLEDSAVYILYHRLQILYIIFTIICIIGSLLSLLILCGVLDKNLSPLSFIMIPFVAILSPAVVFFFNFSAEAHAFIHKKLKEPK